MRGKVAVFALSLQFGIFTLLLGKEKALKFSKLRFFFFLWSRDSPGCPHHLAPDDCSVCCGTFVFSGIQTSEDSRKEAEEPAEGLGSAPTRSRPQFPHLSQESLLMCGFQGPCCP